MDTRNTRKILFLGDSITDCDHCFTRDNLGTGYVTYMAEALSKNPMQTVNTVSRQSQTQSKTGNSSKLQASPMQRGFSRWMPTGDYNDFSLINGGVDGFTLPRICRKWQRMWSGQHFDTVFLLGGINDVGDIMAHGNAEAVAASVLADALDAFDTLLRGLIASGCCRIVVIEPFLFSVPEELVTWHPRLNALCQLLRTRAAQIQAEFPTARISCISVQERFDAAVAKDGVQTMTTDGVHLTEQGHRMLAEILLAYL